MKIRLPRVPRRTRDQTGLALIVTLIIMAATAGLITAVITAAILELRSTLSDHHASRVFYAAEGAGEAILGQIQLALQDGILSDAEISDLEPPTLDGFDFTGYKVVKVGESYTEMIRDGPYAGLQALTEDIEITIPATDQTGSYALVELGAKAQAIPIFQFGVFYEEDLEIHPGPPMDFLGRVHTNGRLYLNANEARYYQLLTTPATVIANYKHKVVSRDGVWIKYDASTFNLLQFDSRSITDPEAFKTRSCADFDCRLQTAAFGVEPLNLPLPEGIAPREIVRPKETGAGGDTPAEQQTKLAWLSETYVTVDLATLTTKGNVCDSGANDDYPTVTVDRLLGPSSINKSWTCKIFSWSFETFVDSREKKPVDVLDVDINELKNWVDAHSTDNVALIYIEFVPRTTSAPAATDPSDDGYYPAVRIKNGQELPGPLTIATEHPLYVWGDYNTVNKQPAAVAGDAYHVLSDAWDDSDHQIIREKNAAGLTDASPTTINVAILAGHSATTCDINEDAGCTTAEYGGGFENYPRFLEDWRDVEYQYLGSIVSLWTAVHALGTWYRGSDDYYRPPIRNWGFDLDLLDVDNMPPGTPTVGAVVRTSFREGY
ncbi:MAG: hypothetical protein GWN99_00980 [Gemmatimonadetes bacterium]|uniref:Type 4 fimbrial biogenesis protein PilX N-terminal domain-containing protein n=1 Tax=Candidatus Kutchimonas denitrificans TaxID=3056748 RepID=A0AAE5CBC5_9BACT|nr:hypothetical protein [Gemmatimonadota bacterium]NIR75662.1 hypothetical protein [Candidatus Kutchimonas denitrificans]NIR99641.1 hypothetical protein [Gemmatimonadota bacterium]NIT65916.1 hypothetical protein [Gemmatimonadota bacterium]NIV22085.1 hypothetical protein [Gemmatimonadota bacterium]